MHPFALPHDSQVSLTTRVGRILGRDFHPATLCGRALPFSVQDTDDKDFLPADCCIGVLVNRRFVKASGRFWRKKSRLFLGVLFFNRERRAGKESMEWIFDVYGGTPNIAMARDLAKVIEEALHVKIDIVLSKDFARPQPEIFGD